MKHFLSMTLILIAGAAVLGAGPAKPNRQGTGWMGGPLSESTLFPADFVLANQSKIGLRDEQILAITKDVSATHERIASVRESFHSVREQFLGLFDAPHVDERDALSLAGQMMDLEKQIKISSMGLMIRVKNQLTPEQQQKLKDLRPSGPALPQGPALDNSE